MPLIGNKAEYQTVFFSRLCPLDVHSSVNRNVVEQFGIRRALHFCVVGSGPAGFYTAEQLLKWNEDVRVDIVDRLPTPFGLVRSGVAPDHPETKNVINQFTRVLSSERCGFIGNVKLGRDVSLDELRTRYHAVVLAYGAESDRKLAIPGEESKGVFAAREVVWWYNGHPEYASLPIDLTSTDTAVILGQGNVALDIARILLRNIEELAATDIASHALTALRYSTIRRVLIVGRRGPAQAACTAKELREILGLKGVSVRVLEDNMKVTAADEEEMKKSRSHKRVYDLLSKAAIASSSTSRASERTIEFVFFRSPVEILSECSSVNGGHKTLKGIRVEKTRLEARPGGPQRALGLGEYEDLPCGLLLRSIGYKSIPVEGLPFDQFKGVVPNEGGRVLKEATSLDRQKSSVEKGLYVVGWLKRGPTGIIGTNLIDANETVNAILQDVEHEMLPELSPSCKPLETLLHERNIPWVSFDEWQKIDMEEVHRGLVKGKPREKIVSLRDMLDVAGKHPMT